MLTNHLSNFLLVQLLRESLQGRASTTGEANFVPSFCFLTVKCVQLMLESLQGRAGTTGEARLGHTLVA